VKVVAIVQARMGSTRLPNKVMKSIGGTPMIELLLARLSKATTLDQIVLATSTDTRNARLIDHVKALGYECVEGSEDDVLERYVKAIDVSKAHVVIRITGDCPLVDPELVDQVVSDFLSSEVDYLSNASPATFPDGLDIEVFTAEVLKEANFKTDQALDREHVTPYLRREGLFRTGAFYNDEDLSSLRWTVDEPTDFEVVSNVFDHFSPNIYFSWREVLSLQYERPDLFLANQNINRNEGASMGQGQKLWKRAKNVIPGGNMLLSKRAEMFLPDLWPAYFSKANGCQVWDLDGKQYTDMSIMGIGTNILGYGHPEVDDAVKQTVDAGNMSTLNCTEEVYLAEKLVDLHQ